VTPFTYRKIQGFTLIELLAAMAIFSLLAVAMYGGVQWVILEREIIIERQTELHDLQRSVAYLNDDFGQLQPRAVRDSLGRDSSPALSANPGTDFIVELSHDGWRNPAGATRGTLQRVQYRLEENMLVREYWPVMDRVLGMEGRIQELLDGVDEFEIEYMDSGGDWQPNWPPLSTAEAETGGVNSLPMAVRYRLETRAFGEIIRLVEIP
jgi:general secretion pathway protein J